MKLTEMKYEAFVKLAQGINDRIDRAANLYNSLLKEADVPMRDETILHNGQIYLDDLYGGIDINWEIFWSYGGHDSGSCYFSMDELLDDTWEASIAKRAKKTIRKYKNSVNAKEKGERKRRRAQYKELKNEFEKD